MYSHLAQLAVSLGRVSYAFLDLVELVMSCSSLGEGAWVRQREMGTALLKPSWKCNWNDILICSLMD